MHLHVLILDGVYVSDTSDSPRFVAIPRLAPAVVEEATHAVHKAVMRMLHSRGLLFEPPPKTQKTAKSPSKEWPGNRAAW